MTAVFQILVYGIAFDAVDDTLEISKTRDDAVIGSKYVHAHVESDFYATLSDA